MDYEEEYYTEEEMEESDIYWQDVRSYYGDDDYDGEWYDDYETEPDDYEPSSYPRTWIGLKLRLFQLELSNWVLRKRLWFQSFRKDPGALMRRCKDCGKRGCVAGSEVCWNDTIPF